MLKKVNYAFAFFLFIAFFYGSVNVVKASDYDATGSDYSPHELSGSIKSMSLSGSKHANKDLNFDSGKKLVYDVYSGVSSGAKKRSWRIETKNFGKGSQPYLTITGWSAILGHRHHYRSNQATYIRAVNTRTGERKTYLAKMTNLDASKDIEYNRSSDPDSIYNLCSSSKRNVNNDECNMKYEKVGFKAFLPLNELFPKGTKTDEWDLYIIKNVGGHILWDYFIVPFQFNNLAFDRGKLNLSSGVNAGKLMMNTSGVVRRSKVRSTESGWTAGYFIQGKTYTRKKQSENETVVWYGVSDHGTKWTHSAYWTFGGSQATLSYQMDKKKCPDGSTVYVNQDCKADVTIVHVDGASGKVLRTDNKKATVGKSYSFSPASRGTFKDSKGRVYVAAPTNQTKSGTTPNNNFTITFKYRVVIPDPTNIKELPNSTEGKAEGEFLWKLEKNSSGSDESRIRLVNDLSIKGIHFATRNVSHSITAAGVFDENQSKPINIYLSNPQDLKNDEVNYKFNYEYTNHYRENYKCVDSQGKDCFEWEFKDNTPVWGKYANSSTWSKNLKVDHKYAETFIFETTSNPNLKLTVGRKAEVNGSVSNSIKTSEQKETFTVNNNAQSILSQNWIGINETVEYSSDFNNPFYILPEYMYYFPNDIDVNLRDTHQNETPFVFSDYVIPLRVAENNNSSLKFKTKDNYFITKNEGLLFSVPRNITSIAEIEGRAREEYENTFGSSFDDKVLNTYAEGSRYYFNIDGNGQEKPNQWYEHVYVLSKLGLSDIQIQIKKKIEFDKYLLGSPADKPLVNEEFGSVIYGDINYQKSIVIPAEKQAEIKELANNRSPLIHSFRSTDIKDKYNQLKSILPSLD